MNTVIKALLILFISAKVVATIIYMLLPKVPVMIDNNVFYGPYIHVEFSHLLNENKVKSHASPISITQLGDLILNGLYRKKNGGYAILANKKNPSKTVIIEVGEIYKGYKLQEIYIDHIELEKDGKNYALYLDKLKNDNILTTSSYDTPLIGHNKIRVHLDDITYYISNQTAIWKNISIRTLKKNNKIYGFKIVWVRRNTKFSELGLKEGDIIIKINNNLITSYENFSRIYKDILKTKKLSLIVLRDEQEKELFYEVE